MPNRTNRQSLGEIFTRDFLLLATINLALFFGFQMTNVGLPVYVPSGLSIFKSTDPSVLAMSTGT